MKKFTFRKILLALATCAASVCACATSVFAWKPSMSPSAPPPVPETECGLYPSSGRGALGLQSRRITLNIDDGDFTAEAVKEGAVSASTATMDYTVVNMSPAAVEEKLFFVCGATPSYGSTETVTVPQITSDGEVPTETRHIKGRTDDYILLNEWYSDAFYSADMPVSVMTVNAEFGEYDRLECTGTVKGDSSKARVITPTDNVEHKLSISLEKQTGGALPVAAAEGGEEQTFYVIGDASALTYEWKVSGCRNGSWTDCSLPVTVESKKTATLKELILSVRPTDSAVNELDWYNAVVPTFSNTVIAANVYDIKNITQSDFYTLCAFDVALEPSASRTYSVTFPIKPYFDTNMSPQINRYSFSIAPTDGWACDNGSELVVKTNQKLSKDRNVDFEPCEGGYKKVYYSSDDLWYATVFLSTEETSVYPDSGNGGLIYSVPVAPLVFVGFLVILNAAGCVAGIVFAVKYRKKKDSDTEKTI